MSEVGYQLRTHRACAPRHLQAELPHIGFGNEVTQFKVGSKTPLDCRRRALLLIAACLAFYPANTKLSLMAPVSRARSKVPSVDRVLRTVRRYYFAQMVGVERRECRVRAIKVRFKSWAVTHYIL